MAGRSHAQPQLRDSAVDPEDLARLTRNLRAATDEALVALANRGLVRRAAKDVESESLRVEVTDAAVLVHGVSWTVTMPPDGPAAATDNTPATGVTRQILAATMHLRDRWLTAQSTPAPAADEPANTDGVAEAIRQARECLIEAPSSELFKWAGKTPVLEASASLDSLGAATISDAPLLKVEFAAAGVSVVLMTDQPAKTLRKLLDQFKTTSNKSEQARWVMIAVLAIKRAAGKSTVVDREDGATLSEAVRGDRRRIAWRSVKLLRAIAASGIAHPSSRIVERLHTASVAAEAARHPRLARLLHSIASDAELQIARNAGADPNRMVQRMVVAHALAEATARPENAERSDLFGRPRTLYSPAGDLELCGLGAHGWRTASGYEGLTTVFWDLQGKQFLTATAARGEGQDRTFTLRSAYESGLGWSGGAAVETMCRRNLRLTGAKVNIEGRLSLAESCRAAVGELVNPNEIDFGDRAIADWQDLARVLRDSQPLGLRVPDTRAALVVVRPAQWGQRWFDELDQSFVWQIHDAAGSPAEIRVPWTEVTEASVLFLESILVERDRPTAILGRIEVRSVAIHIYPLSVFTSGTPRGDLVLCPQFDQFRIRSRNEALLTRLREKYQRFQKVQTRIGDEGDEENEGDIGTQTGLRPIFGALIDDVETILGAALETGATRLSEDAAATLAKARERFSNQGLEPMAQSLSMSF
jgi:hypothetical protein